VTPLRRMALVSTPALPDLVGLRGPGLATSVLDERRWRSGQGHCVSLATSSSVAFWDAFAWSVVGNLRSRWDSLRAAEAHVPRPPAGGTSCALIPLVLMRTLSSL
jgi:hypothetical protein